MPALVFLITTLSSLYLLTFLLRILLQASRADFYNPISEFIVRVTNPLVRPARRIIPAFRGVDVPTLVVLVLLELIVTLMLVGIVGVRPSLAQVFWLVVFRLVYLTLWTYTICVVVYAILSWVVQAAYSPIAMLLSQIVEPVLRPARRILPLVGGFDLSPLLVIILIQAASIAIRLSIAPLVVPGLAGLIR